MRAVLIAWVFLLATAQVVGTRGACLSSISTQEGPRHAGVDGAFWSTPPCWPADRFSNNAFRHFPKAENVPSSHGVLQRFRSVEPSRWILIMQLRGMSLASFKWGRPFVVCLHSMRKAFYPRELTCRASARVCSSRIKTEKYVRARGS